MKRLALSTLSLSLLAAAGAAHAQTSVTLYGVIDTSLTFIHNTQDAAQGASGAAGNRNQWLLGNSSAGNLSGSRFGMKGNEDLGGGLAAIFTLEGGFNPSTGQSGQGGALFGRQAFVGLSSNTMGTITLGRQYDPLVDLVQPITEDNYFGSVFATVGDVDNYDNSSRTNNAIKYLSPTIAGFQFEGMYALGGVAGTTGSNQSWAAALAYNNGPIGIAAGYWFSDNANTGGAPRTTWSSTSSNTFDGSPNTGYLTSKSLGVARIAGQFVAGPFTMGLGYSNAQYKPDAASAFGETEKYNTGQGFLNYQATPALLTGVGYSYTKASGDTSATYHQVSVGADYSLSKRTDVYFTAAYQHASGETRLTTTDGTVVVTAAQASIGSYGYNGTNTQELVNVGLRHKF
jgi:predicted porin